MTGVQTCALPIFDSREFGKVEKQIQQMERTLNMFKDKPDAYYSYLSKNPFAEILVEQYNSNVNGRLKEIRADLNKWRRLQGITEAERKHIVDSLILEQNIIKRVMIEEFKAYGVQP